MDIKARLELMVQSAEKNKRVIERFLRNNSNALYYMIAMNEDAQVPRPEDVMILQTRTVAERMAISMYRANPNRHVTVTQCISKKPARIVWADGRRVEDE